MRMSEKMNTLSDAEWEAIQNFLSSSQRELSFKPGRTGGFLCNDVLLHPLQVNRSAGHSPYDSGIRFDSEEGINKFIEMIPILAEKFNAVDWNARLWDGEKGVNELPPAHNTLSVGEANHPSALSFGKIGTGRYGSEKILADSRQFIKDNRFTTATPERGYSDHESATFRVYKEMGMEIASPHYLAAIDLMNDGKPHHDYLLGLFTDEQWKKISGKASVDERGNTIHELKSTGGNIIEDVLIQISHLEKDEHRHITSVAFKMKFQNYYQYPNKIFQNWFAQRNDKLGLLPPSVHQKSDSTTNVQRFTDIYTRYQKTPMFKEYKSEYERLQADAIAYLNHSPALKGLILKARLFSEKEGYELWLDIEQDADGVYYLDFPSLDTYDGGAFFDFYRRPNRYSGWGCGGWFPNLSIEVSLHHKENTEPQAFHVLYNLPKILTELETYHKVMSEIVALTHRDDLDCDDIYNEIVSLLAPFDYAVMKEEEE